jgi:hypothetical protein
MGQTTLFDDGAGRRRRGSGTVSRATSSAVRNLRDSGRLGADADALVAALRVAADTLDRLGAAGASGYELAAAVRAFADCHDRLLAVASPAVAATADPLAVVRALRA